MDVGMLMEWSLWFAWSIVRAAVLTIPVFVLAVVVTGLGRRWLAPWVRWAIWSLVLVRLLMPVSIGSPLSLQRLLGSDWSEVTEETQSFDPLPNPEDGVRASTTRDLVFAEAISPGSSISAAPTADDVRFADAAEIALAALLAGMAIMGLWTLITTVRLRLWLRRGTECGREDWLQMLAEGRKRFGIFRLVELRTLPGLGSPATCGWLQPTILLPEDMLDWSPAEMRHILWHELAHIRRRDVATSGGLAIARILHWWNPVFWWTQRCWLLERELACDAMVLRHLERGDAPQYGETLLRVLERLVGRGRGIASLAPGFVFFLGRKRAVRRRLAELSRSAAPETRGRRWVACGALVCLALISLTDPVRARPAPRPTGIALPAETVWTLLPAEPPLDIARETREYQLRPAIDRYLRDEPKEKPEAIVQDMEHVFRALLQTPREARAEFQAGHPIPFSKDGSSYEVRGETLIVRGTAEQHEEIAALLARWSRDNRQQIGVVARLASTSLSLEELLPGPGGTVLSMPAGQEQPDLGTMAAWTRHDVPAFVRVLSDAEMRHLMRKLQSDRDSNVLFAPKILTYDGQSAFVQMATVRPYVTGLQTGAASRLEPVVSEFTVGPVVQVRPMIEEDGGTRLVVQCRITEVADVDHLSMTHDGKSVTLQVPHVSSMQISTAQSIPAGHTLLVAPLERDATGNVYVAFFSAEQLP